MSASPPVPTLEDVARAAGVSTATVSRCLNERQKVSEATLKKVMQAVNHLGYTPNFSARAMAAKRTFTIGAIIPTMENAIFAQGLQAFQETLHARGYNLLVSSSAYQPELEAEQIEALVARGADGLLLIGYERDSTVYEYLQRRGVPVVLAWASDPEKDHASVGFDNRVAMRLLADKVIEVGHRRAGVISGIVAGNDRAARRLDGIRESWDAHGLDHKNLRVIQTRYEMETGAEAFKKLIENENRPSAVMCGNDVLAVGALSQAQHMGLDVPGDVSITGFDDIELAKHVSPTLTTVHVPHRTMGSRAAESLLELIENKGSASTVELPVSLKLRQSLGPA